MKPIIVLLALALLGGCGGDALTADQRRAVEVALEVMPQADRAEVERRAESWGHEEIAKVHKMAALKKARPDLFHEAQATVERLTSPR